MNTQIHTKLHIVINLIKSVLKNMITNKSQSTGKRVNFFQFHHTEKTKKQETYVLEES